MITNRKQRRQRRQQRYNRILQQRIDRAHEDLFWTYRQLDVVHAMMLRRDAINAEETLERRVMGDALLVASLGLVADDVDGHLRFVR